MTPHFTLSELTRSSTAQSRNIDNSPSPRHKQNLLRLAQTLENVRTLLGNNPIVISSGYRSPELNVAVGGSKTSAHSKGLAADFTCRRFGSVKEIFEAIKASDIEYDQLIHEDLRGRQWIHLGLSEGKPRRQNLLINSKGAHLA